MCARALVSCCNLKFMGMYTATKRTEYEAFSLVVRIGTPPTPLPAGECPPPLWLVGAGGAHSLAGDGGGGPKSDEGTDTVVL